MPAASYRKRGCGKNFRNVLTLMKTFIRILQFLFVFLLVSLIVAVIALKFVNLNKYKNFFENKLTQQIGRPVDIGGLSLQLSWTKGVTLEVKDVRIKDLLKMASASVVFDLRSYIRNRQMIITEITLQGPEVRLVKPAANAPGKEPVPPSAVSQKDATTASAKSTPSNIAIHKIEIKDGIFTYVDPSEKAPVEMRLADVHVLIKNFALDRFFSFALDGALWSARPDIHLEGEAKLASAGQGGQLRTSKIEVNLGAVELNQVMRSFAGTEALKDVEDLEGDLAVNVEDLSFQNGSFDTMDASLRLQNGTFKHAALAVPLKNLDVTASWKNEDIRLQKIGFSLAEGTGEITGDLKNVFAAPAYHLAVGLKGIQLKTLLDESRWPVLVEGKVQTEMNLEGEGFSRQDLQRSLKGKGKVQFVEGRIVDFNLLREVLNQLSFAPNLKSKLSEKYKAKLEQKDTVIDQAAMNLDIIAGHIILTQGQLAAEGFVHKSKGSLDFNQTLDLDASLYLTGGLARELVRIVNDFQYFQDASGQIIIPFRHYHGPLRGYHPYPDVEDILKGALKQRAKEEATKAILKALNLDTESVPSTGGTLSTPSSPEKAIIENVLDSIKLFQ